jgi:hypothetical protein
MVAWTKLEKIWTSVKGCVCSKKLQVLNSHQTELKETWEFVNGAFFDLQWRPSRKTRCADSCAGDCIDGCVADDLWASIVFVDVCVDGLVDRIVSTAVNMCRGVDAFECVLTCCVWPLMRWWLCGCVLLLTALMTVLMLGVDALTRWCVYASMRWCVLMNQLDLGQTRGLL